MTASFKTVLGFASEEAAAEASAIIGESPGFEDYPLVLLQDGGRWFLECYDGGALSGLEGQSLLEGLTPASVAVEPVPDADWVSETQKALPPVRAGRFTIHGSHDRRRVLSQWAIEIDAGRAFGTAHHGTTRGCLLALDRVGSLLRFKPLTPALSLRERESRARPLQRRPLSQGERDRVRGWRARKAGDAVFSILDLGTGSGVLAIAAAKAFAHSPRIAAVDLDAVAIDVARENCRKNGAAAVRLFVGDGAKPHLAYEASPFDLVMANILARPLLKLAPRLAELTRPGGVLILSGLLSGQAREILARYRATGFHLLRRSDLEGWATLTLMRAS